MKKADLAEAAYRRHGGIPRRQATEIVDCLFSAITRALADGERVLISGFGSFRVKPRKARMGRNPQTGDRLIIPAGKRITFRPSNLLVELVNHKSEPPSGRRRRWDAWRR